MRKREESRITPGTLKGITVWMVAQFTKMRISRKYKIRSKTFCFKSI